MSGRADTAQILLKAADIIETRGWCQGDFFDLETAFVRKRPIHECAVCVRGALNVAAGSDPSGTADSADARKDAVDALAFHLGYDPEDPGQDPARFVTGWNDWRAMSAKQVVTALRETAAELAGGA